MRFWTLVIPHLLVYLCLFCAMVYFKQCDCFSVMIIIIVLFFKIVRQIIFRKTICIISLIFMNPVLKISISSYTYFWAIVEMYLFSFIHMKRLSVFLFCFFKFKIRKPLNVIIMRATCKIVKRLYSAHLPDIIF